MSRSSLYATLRADSSGCSHLIVIDLHGLGAARRLSIGLRELHLTMEVLLLADRDRSEILPQAPIRRFATPDELLGGLRAALSEHGMGTRLYVAGTESFVGSVAVMAREHGLQESAIQREACGPRRRRVYCIHCRTLTPDIAGNALSCPGCGRALEVREHYSPRLGAYLGLCSDAPSVEVHSR